MQVSVQIQPATRFTGIRCHLTIYWHWVYISDSTQTSLNFFEGTEIRTVHAQGQFVADLGAAGVSKVIPALISWSRPWHCFSDSHACSCNPEIASHDGSCFGKPTNGMSKPAQLKEDISARSSLLKKCSGSGVKQALETKGTSYQLFTCILVLRRKQTCFGCVLTTN